MQYASSKSRSRALLEEFSTGKFRHGRKCSRESFWRLDQAPQHTPALFPQSPCTGGRSHSSSCFRQQSPLEQSDTRLRLGVGSSGGFSFSSRSRRRFFTSKRLGQVRSRSARMVRVLFQHRVASMVFINGIATFTFTSGRRVQSHKDWTAFFHPTFFPALAFRFVISLWRESTADQPACRKDAKLKVQMGRWSGSWMLPLLIALVSLGWW